MSGTSVYVAGTFTGNTAGFGATTLTNANTSPFSTDVFVAKLTDVGATSSFAWSQRVRCRLFWKPHGGLRGHHPI